MRMRSPRRLSHAVPEVLGWRFDLLSGYEDFCRRVRQLDAGSIRQQRTYLVRFLDWLSAGTRDEFLQRLTSRSLQRFQLEYARDHGPGSRRWLQQSLRGLLRFLRLRGDLGQDLTGSVGTVHCTRLATVPKGIDADSIRRLLESIDRSSAHGRRDFAILALLSTYGVRGGQLRRLCLQDIDWQNHRIHFPALKRGNPVDQVLTPGAGNSLLAYIHDGRPSNSSCPEVFLSFDPPFRPFRRAASFSEIVGQRLRQAGIVLAPGVSHGTHSFRHAFAMRLAGRVPFKHLADLLGHRDPASTWIYAKVDFAALAETAQPWPEEVQR